MRGSGKPRIPKVEGRRALEGKGKGKASADERHGREAHPSAEGQGRTWRCIRGEVWARQARRRLVPLSLFATARRHWAWLRGAIESFLKK